MKHAEVHGTVNNIGIWRLDINPFSKVDAERVEEGQYEHLEYRIWFRDE